MLLLNYPGTDDLQTALFTIEEHRDDPLAPCASSTVA